jgi:hypothetical protein
MLKPLLVPAVLFTLAGLVGCSGSAAKPVTVSGTVELDGKPMPEGTITLAGEGGTVPATIDIKDGKFEGKATPGKKRVEIRAFRLGKSTKMGEEVIEAGPENYLPAAYNTQSKITADVSDAGISPDKFEVKSK